MAITHPNEVEFVRNMRMTPESSKAWNWAAYEIDGDKYREAQMWQEARQFAAETGEPIAEGWEPELPQWP